MNQSDILGWIGAVLVLHAYFLISSGKADPKSQSFQLMNIAGAFLLVCYTYSCDAYASMMVNIIWVLIGVGSYIKLLKRPNFRLKKGLLMTTKTKLIAFAFGIFILVGTQTTYSQDWDETSSDEAVVEESSESFTDESETSDDSGDSNSEVYTDDSE